MIVPFNLPVHVSSKMRFVATLWLLPESMKERREQRPFEHTIVKYKRNVQRSV
jgi:hypothetical protein